MTRPNLLLLLAVLAGCHSLVAQGGGGVRLGGDWQQRDLEGKWVVFQSDLERHLGDRDRRQDWIGVLAEAKEYELLEWIGIYQGWREVGPLLKRLGAPQWIRVSHWNLASRDIAERELARNSLMEGGVEVLSWLGKFAETRAGPASSVYATLMREHSSEAKVPHWPPLDAESALLDPLRAPGRAVPWGDRLTAERGDTYRHQVARALQGTVRWDGADPELPELILPITRSLDDDLRMLAYEALARLRGEFIPWKEMAVVAIDPEARAEDRKAAVRALSFSTHPGAYMVLIEILKDPDHAGFAPAVERLGAVGGPYFIAKAEVLALIAEGERQELLRRSLGQAKTRCLPRNLLRQDEFVRTMLLRAVWARQAGYPHAGRFMKVTEKALMRLEGGVEIALRLDTLAEGVGGVPGSGLAPDELDRLRVSKNVWQQMLMRKRR